MALHDAGLLHRDVKPSNVLVRHDGRVVLLDFGLVAELDDHGAAITMTEHIVGTPAYMSPEQGLGGHLTAATDWYAVGVVLYEALTGRTPFEGASGQILVQKGLVDPTAPLDLVRGVPPKLSELCMDLLSRTPERRPTGPELLERLRGALPFGAGASVGSTPAAAKATDVELAASLVGREPHLWALDEALDEVEAGHSVIAMVPGAAGMGKTSLVRHFLSVTRKERRDALVFEGRCYEREAVPYKALDSLVDAICRHLLRLPEADLAAVLPRDLAALARVFPVLVQLRGALGKRAQPNDVVEQRRRAFMALRELLHRMSTKSLLVLFVDDLQWGDADSEPLLAALLRGPEPPPLLFLTAYRSEDAASAPLVATLHDLGREADGPLVCEIPVAELPEDAARELAKTLLPMADASAVASLASESAGSPLFLRQLAALGAGHGRATDLAEAILFRVHGLSPESRALLEALALFGKPTEVSLAAGAADVRGDRDAIVHELRGHSLVRTHTRAGRSEVEVYHDRIREIVVGAMDGGVLAALHLRIARVLAVSQSDPEALTEHYLAANEPALARRFAEDAADRAGRALAFDRAARMYALALELDASSGASNDELVLKLAEALASAGRGPEAAERFLHASRTASGARQLELRRRGAEQLLFAGHLEEGGSVVESILETLAIASSRSPLGSLVALLFRRLLLRLRGMRFRPSTPDTVAQQTLVRIDTFFSLARGFGILDPWRGMEFQSRFVLSALAAGEPSRIAMGLALEAAYRAADGFPARPAIEQLLRRAGALADATRDARARGVTSLMRGVAATLLGDFADGAAACDAAAEELRDHCTGVWWELDNATIFGLYARLGLGRINEIRSRLPEALDDASARGDLYAEVLLRVQVSWFVRLADDDTAAARRELDVLTERWSAKKFLIQHAWHALNLTEVELYVGDAERAYKTMRDVWRQLERQLYLRAETMRVRAMNARARAALALAATVDGAARGRLLAEARALEGRIARERWPLARGFARLLGAARLVAEGDGEGALPLLRDAEFELRARGAALYANAAQVQRGALEGTASGHRALELGLQGFRDEGIRDPSRMVRVFAPGAWPARAAADGGSRSA